uniref:Dihydropteridine reductase n=1 Tax=Heterorhabditis bacteriophora TaxID=37862 RepID=A0A1I7X571_HETBA
MSAGKIIVYGGKGALGSTIIEHFKANNFWTLSIDLVANDTANACVQVDGSASWTVQEHTILSGVAAVLDSPVDGIFCVADLMWKQSVWSSTIAAKIATKHLKPGGLLQLTGAAAASEGTPGMIGYGMAKAAVHQLTSSLASEGSGLPEQCTVLTILPITLDTPMNRKWMPKFLSFIFFLSHNLIKLLNNQKLIAYFSYS